MTTPKGMMKPHIEVEFEVTDNPCEECQNPHSNWRIVRFVKGVGTPAWACGMHHATQMIDEWMNDQLDDVANRELQGNRTDDLYND